MLLTREMVKRIKAACNKVYGQRLIVEIAYREHRNGTGETTANALLWLEDADLDAVYQLDHLVGSYFDGDWIELDCMCWRSFSIIGNASILIHPNGTIVHAANYSDPETIQKIIKENS